MRPAHARGAQPTTSGDARGPVELLGFDTKPPIKVAAPLTYSDGRSKKRELDIRFVMTLCAPGDKTTPNC